MEEKIKQRRSHRLNMEDRKRLENLHVNRLSVEKGELDIDGSIQSLEYSEVSSFGKKGESFFSRLMR